jgi:hypothetical protein
MNNSLVLWGGGVVAAWMFWPQIVAAFQSFTGGGSAKAATPSGSSTELLQALRTKMRAAGIKREQVEELVEPIRLAFVMAESD